METLTKETGLLHRVLSRHLPEVSVRMVMRPVFGNYREQWGKAFGEVKVKTEGGKQRYVISGFFPSDVSIPLYSIDFVV
jgi:vacuolar protein sorting-associated protein 54